VTINRQGSPEAALGWLLHKEDQELSMMKGQSSSWFYIEELNIGDLFINVTLSLTSNIDVTGAHGGGDVLAATGLPAQAEKQREKASGAPTF
jgi:hypothetical protein